MPQTTKPSVGHSEADPIIRVRYVKEPATGRAFTEITAQANDDDRVIVVLPRGDASKRHQLFEALDNRGVRYLSESEKKRILELVRSAPFDSTGTITIRTGWHGDQYVRPTGRVLGTGKDIILLLPEALERSTVIGGTLDGWRAGVAAPARYSSTIAFAISMGFAASVIARTSVKSGILHIHGKSSKGKTTGIRGANSVGANGNDYETWDKTVVSFEERAAQYSGALSTYDEIERLTGSAEEIVNQVRNIAFKIEGEKGRARSRKYAPKGDTVWKSLALSTGEVSITALAAKAGIKRTPGDVVRLIDVPAISSAEKGLFDRLPASIESAPFRELIEKYSATHYGVACEEFLDCFLRDVGTHDAVLKRWMEKFMRAAEVPIDSWEQRFAGRFALIYAAARLAARFNILPWDNAFIFEIVLRHYRGARANAPIVYVDPMRSMLRIFEALCEADRFIWDTDIEDTKLAPEDFDGYLRGKGDDLIYIVKPNALQNWLGPDVDLSVFGEHLLKMGVLVIEQRGLPTKQVSFRGLRHKSRYYCFSQKELSKSEAIGNPHRRRQAA